MVRRPLTSPRGRLAPRPFAGLRGEVLAMGRFSEQDHRRSIAGGAGARSDVCAHRHGRRSPHAAWAGRPQQDWTN